jgi:hypothetical protein
VEVTDAEAGSIRSFCDDGKWRGGSDRIWLPIEIVTATGRARCRACGEPIRKGRKAIRFGFQLNPKARTIPAYIHPDCEQS